MPLDSSAWTGPPPPKQPPPPKLGWKEQVAQVGFIVTALGWLAGPMVLAMAIANGLEPPRIVGAVLMIAGFAWFAVVAAALVGSPRFRVRVHAFLQRPVPRFGGLGAGIAFALLVLPPAVEDRLDVTLPLPLFWRAASEWLFP